MRVKQHPNYYVTLLLMGAKVVEPIKMQGENSKGKRRVWNVSAKLKLNGFTFYLQGGFVGALTETEEVAAANLNINYLKIDDGNVAGVEEKSYQRDGHGLLMLEDGIYILPEKTQKSKEVVRSLVNYDTTQYVGIPTGEEKSRISSVGYLKLLSW